MKAVVISNGEVNNDNFYKELFHQENPQYIICADGGAKHLRRLGIVPTTIIGDLDSIPMAELEFYKEKSIEIIKYDIEKDETDTQLAIQYVMSLPIKEVILVGMLGSRMDHTLANVYLLKSLLDKGLKASIVNEHNRIYLMDKSIELKGRKGETLSLLPFTDRVDGITTEGLHYSLKDAVMTKDNPYGISNVVKGGKVKITINKGILLVILAQD